MLPQSLPFHEWANSVTVKLSDNWPWQLFDFHYLALSFANFDLNELKSPTHDLYTLALLRCGN